MKKLLFPLFVFIFLTTWAQRVDLDREYVQVAYVQLPSNPILDNSLRTYSTNDNDVSVAGFSKVSTGGSLELHYSFLGTMLEDFRIESRKHEKKNKDGKVISTSYTYMVQASYRSTADFEVINHLTGESYRKTYRESSHKSSRSYKTRRDAQRYFEDNRYSLMSRYRTEHTRKTLESAKRYINTTYGYPINYARDNFWILDSKKHPEYAQHNKAFNDAKRILAKMKYNESVTTIERELQPVIKYFIETVDKYPGKKKRMKKMRYASYYNLAKIYYYLDNVAKTKEYGQKIIDNKYDKKDGKSFIRKANLLEERLNVNQVTSRHFGVLTEDLTDAYSDRVEEVVADEILAYLITIENDTIQATIPRANIATIAYEVNLLTTDDAGDTQVQRFNATACKTMALTNEDLYQVVRFNEVKKEAGSTEAKFVKVLFESDKIQLFLFKNKELVIKRSNDEKGKSTLSSDFAFGFNKKLASYAKDCPSVLAETRNKTYKNTEESLLAFCEALTLCE